MKRWRDWDLGDLSYAIALGGVIVGGLALVGIGFLLGWLT